MPDVLVCLSHLRWDHGRQRPQHVMSRLARTWPVLFVEEPVGADGPPGVEVARPSPGVTVLRPVVPAAATPAARVRHQADVLAAALGEAGFDDPILWYGTPAALAWTRGIDAALRIYDCTGEPGGSTAADEALPVLEEELAARADVVLAGGRGLAAAKAHLHPDVRCVASSVDVEHFAPARDGLPEPDDLRDLPRPRIGFAGPVDDRVDLGLVAGIAALRPAWQIVLVGAIAIAPGRIPAAPGIHLLGPRPYDELPAYLGGWDVGLVPFARTEATRLLAPTQPAEYLAAGLPVVSTRVADVVHPFARLGLARIADTPKAAVEAIERALASHGTGDVARADGYLRTTSWDRTVGEVQRLVESALARRPRAGAAV